MCALVTDGFADFWVGAPGEDGRSRRPVLWLEQLLAKQGMEFWTALDAPGWHDPGTSWLHFVDRLWVAPEGTRRLPWVIARQNADGVDYVLDALRFGTLIILHRPLTKESQ